MNDNRGYDINRLHRIFKYNPTPKNKIPFWPKSFTTQLDCNYQPRLPSVHTENVTNHQTVRLLSAVSLIGVILILIVFTGFYAMLYKRTDDIRRTASSSATSMDSAHGKTYDRSDVSAGSDGQQTCDDCSKDTSVMSEWQSSSDCDDDDEDDDDDDEDENMDNNKNCRKTGVTVATKGALAKKTLKPDVVTASGWNSHYVSPQRHRE